MAAKKAKERLKTLEEMSTEEREAFLKKPIHEQELYKAKLAVQTAEETAAKAREDAEKARERGKRDRAIESGVKKIIASIREGKHKLEDAPTLLKALAQTETGATTFDTTGPTDGRTSLNVTEEEAKGFLDRIKTESEKAAPSSGGGGKSIPAPTYKLTHTLIGVKKSALIPPTDGGRPDATLTALMRLYGPILPLLIAPAPGAQETEQRFTIMDGKRRYYLLNETEEYPAVIVSGFPDEGTAEAAEIAINRGRSLNVLRAGEVIARSRARGKTDAQIRASMGFKTGEVDKYASASTLPQELGEALKAGLMMPATALTLGKSSKAVVEAVRKDYLERKAKETADAPARITEADVDRARQAGAAAAVTRDAPTLRGLTEGVETADATGAASGGASSGASASSAGASPMPEKVIDNGGATADNAPAWVEGAFEKLGEVLEAIPQDAPAPVLSLYREVHAALTEAAGGIEFATVPELTPAPTFKAPKKAAVENTVESRTGWKASVLSRFKGLAAAIPADAPANVLSKVGELKTAVTEAKAGATE